MANGSWKSDVPLRDTAMGEEYKVQKAGLAGQNWTTVFSGSEVRAREIFERQLRLYSIGRFRLLDPTGKIIEERKAQPQFCFN
jgi:hypothetical protein